MRDLWSVLGWAQLNLLSWHLLNTPAHRLARLSRVARNTQGSENEMARCSIKPFPDLSQLSVTSPSFHDPTVYTPLET